MYTTSLKSATDTSRQFWNWEPDDAGMCAQSTTLAHIAEAMLIFPQDIAQYNSVRRSVKGLEKLRHVVGLE